MTWKLTQRGLLPLVCLACLTAPLFAGEAEPAKPEEAKKEATQPLKAPDYSSPKATMQTLWEGAKAGSRERVLSCFDEASRKAILELEKVLAEAVKEVPEMKKELGEGDMIAKMCEELKKKEPKIGEEKIDGEKAILKVTVDDREDPIPFVREKDTWKMRLPGEIPTPEKMREMVNMMKTMMKAMKEKPKDEPAPK